jgi:hypothetical protein
VVVVQEEVVEIIELSRPVVIVPEQIRDPQAAEEVMGV